MWMIYVALQRKVKPEDICEIGHNIFKGATFISQERIS
jgi:hypothetical protein